MVTVIAYLHSFDRKTIHYGSGWQLEFDVDRSASSVEWLRTPDAPSIQRDRGDERSHTATAVHQRTDPCSHVTS